MEKDYNAFDYYVKGLAGVPLLSLEEERILLNKVYDWVNSNYDSGKEQEARDAQEKLLKHNYRLVISVAKKFLCPGMEMMDLVQEGNQGLLHATEKFDPKLENRFSTYATFWIEQSIRRACQNQASLIRIPTHMQQSIKDAKEATYQLKEKLNREPTPEELAEELECSVDQAKQILSYNYSYSSLNQMVGDDDTSLEHFFASEDDNPLEVVEKDDFNSKIYDSLKTLNDKEQFVLIHYFGLAGSKRLTLEDIGQMLSVSRERVRQIEGQALNKLRRNPMIKEIASLMIS